MKLLVLTNSENATAKIAFPADHFISAQEHASITKVTRIIPNTNQLLEYSVLDKVVDIEKMLK